MCKEDNYKKITVIILDNAFKVIYSNIDNQKAIEHIKNVVVIEKLSENFPIEYDFDTNHIIIDKINISNNICYLITTVGYSMDQYYKRVFVDLVTGLYNRNYWERIKRKDIKVNEMKGLSLILLDIDNLKKINDTFGHLEGDKAIKIVGFAIRNGISKSDIAIRYGGDEFIIILPNQDVKAAEKIIERIKNEIKILSMNQIIDISVGISDSYSDFNIDEMLQIADQNLYQEKNGKKKYCNKTNELYNIKIEIEKIKNELDKNIIFDENKLVLNDKIFNISKKLDELIFKYSYNSRKNINN